MSSPHLTTHKAHSHRLLTLLSGALLPFGFAPFHVPGLALLGLAFFFIQLSQGLKLGGKAGQQHALMTGFIFGLGYFGLGVSWMFVSIHDYGHLNVMLAGLITLLFIAYLSVFTSLMALVYHLLALKHAKLSNGLIFTALWCLSEYGRATFLTGFPWLLLGYGQIDTPLRYLLPLIGVYGVGFFACFAACCLAMMAQTRKPHHLPWLLAFVGLLITPLALKNIAWTTPKGNPISVGIIQANLSMKDKWDEAIFLKVLAYYQQEINQLMGKKQLIVLPESAIPAPDSYVSDFLSRIHQQSLESHTALLLGIPEEPSRETYYNSLLGLGHASGAYEKRHLVPFGEFIPKPFQQVAHWLSIPITDISAGRHFQPLITVNHHPIATLICYEVAYPQLLREQLPKAEWIVSISDDGWFGHSFAMAQQLQMAQVLSLQTGRYQIVANNDGLSSIINTKGVMMDSLPAYQAGVLSGYVVASTGKSPWVAWGDGPILLLSLLIFISGLVQQIRYFRVAPIVPNHSY